MKKVPNDFGLVSIVIPCFNAEQFICSSVDSALSQTYENIEIIVVDDCSTDSSLDFLMERYHSNSKVSIYSLPKNTGTPASPRNFGVKKSGGRYIAFLDGDDIWHPDKLLLQLQLFSNSAASMCSTNIVDFRSESEINISRISGSTSVSRISVFRQMEKYRTPTSSILLRRETAFKYDFPESLFYRGREDLIYSLTLHAAEGLSLKINLPLVYYRRHKEQISSKKLRMYLLVILILFKSDLQRHNWLKCLMPYFILSNVFYSFYYRVLLNRL